MTDVILASLLGGLIDKGARWWLKWLTKHHLDAGMRLIPSVTLEESSLDLGGGLLAHWRTYRIARAWHETQLMKSSAPLRTS